MNHQRSISIAKNIIKTTNDLIIYSPGTIDSSSTITGYTYTGLITELYLYSNIEFNALIKLWLSDGANKFPIKNSIRVSGSDTNLNLVAYFTNLEKFTLTKGYSIGITLAGNTMVDTDQLTIFGTAFEEGIPPKEEQVSQPKQIMWGDITGVLNNQVDLIALLNKEASPISSGSSSMSVLSYRQQVINDSPYFYLPLDEVSGTIANDLSGNNRNGVYQGSFTLGVRGKSANDKAVELTDGKITFNGEINAPSFFAVECAFKTTDQSGTLIGFFGSGGYDRELILVNGKLVFFVYEGARLESAQTFHDNSWHRVTALISSSGTQLWADGVMIAFSTITLSVQYPGNWRIGIGNYAPTFKGIINEVSVVHNSLNQERIQARHQAAIN